MAGHRGALTRTRAETLIIIKPTASAAFRVRSQRIASAIAHQTHVVTGECPLQADVAGEGVPPAQYRTGPVAVAVQERDVEEQPGQPARESAEMQAPGGDRRPAAGNVGGRAEVPVAERPGGVPVTRFRLARGVFTALDLAAGLARRVQPGLH